MPRTRDRNPDQGEPCDLCLFVGEDRMVLGSFSGRAAAIRVAVAKGWGRYQLNWATETQEIHVGPTLAIGPVVPRPEGKPYHVIPTPGACKKCGNPTSAEYCSRCLPPPPGVGEPLPQGWRRINRKDTRSS